jgi:hypothetical protein
MVFRLLSLVVGLAVMGVLASTMRDRIHTTQNPSNPASPANLLHTAGMALDRSHELTGRYTLGLQGGDASALRLVSADANGYCLQLAWIGNQVWHLQGPGGTPAQGAC